MTSARDEDIIVTSPATPDLSTASLTQNRRARLLTWSTTVDTATSQTIFQFDFFVPASPVEQRVEMFLCEWRGKLDAATVDWTVVTRLAVRVSPYAVRCTQPLSYRAFIDTSLVWSFYNTNYSAVDGGRAGGVDAWTSTGNVPSNRQGASYVQTNANVQRWWRGGLIPLDDFDLEQRWLKETIDATVDLSASTWLWSTVNLVVVPRNRQGNVSLRSSLIYARVPQTHINQLELTLVPQRVVVSLTPRGTQARRSTTALLPNSSFEYVAVALPSNCLPEQDIDENARDRFAKHQPVEGVALPIRAVVGPPLVQGLNVGP